MKIKKIAIAGIVLLGILSGLTTSAQIKNVKNLPKYNHGERLHFGFTLAANQMLFSLKMKPGFEDRKYTNVDIGGDSAFLYALSPQPTVGFTIGIVSDLRMGKYFNLRFVPSLAFGERYLNYSILQYDFDEQNQQLTTTLVDIQKNVPSTFVEFPFHIKYRSKRMNNIGAYLLAGAKYTLDLASNANKKKDNADETYIKLSKHDAMMEVGVGFDFYTEFFKFGVEAKMGYGLTDIMQRDETIYSEEIERINSKVFMLSFTFE
ncbi:MAG: PorT family protein [Bacteroidales bacterium]|nr:PorT family protein [Bacteroidales bacterium]MCF8343456.1 PorT family protein [Bacteroidales bacterium]MCF8375662.1 PorT family protein [Bacteroidales bacterium]MCF8401460.1 PorT family protein [Bacteroidales bacterium]